MPTTTGVIGNHVASTGVAADNLPPKRKQIQAFGYPRTMTYEVRRSRTDSDLSYPPVRITKSTHVTKYVRCGETD